MWLQEFGMSRYRRMYVPGGTYFFTVTLAQRGGDLLVREIDALRKAVRVTRAERPFEIDAFVVLPDHLHGVWTLPEGDADFSTRWGAIKARFTRDVRRAGFCAPSQLPQVLSGEFAGVNPGVLTHKGEVAIWQRRFWEHSIRDAADYAAHVEYCHWNPVKHGFVEQPEDWPYSTVHRGVREGRVA